MNPIEFKMTKTQAGTADILALTGHLNALSAPELEAVVTPLLASETKRLIFDCSALNYASSAGLRVFVMAVKRLKSTGRSCAFAGLTPPVQAVFEMSGFLEVMEVYPTLQEATA
jgi:anti-anti-sigma factor